jgi:N-acetylmuramoyl-L-alanine amidase
MRPLIRRTLALAALALMLGPAPPCRSAAAADNAAAVTASPGTAMDASATAASASLDLGAPEPASASASTAASASAEASAETGLPPMPVASPETPPRPAPLAWRLSLAGRKNLLLRSLDKDRPLFPVKDAALYSGLSLRWRSSEKLLQVSLPKAGVLAYLVLGNDFFVVQGRRVGLEGPMVLAQGAPALGPEDLRSLIESMGGARPRWRPVSPQEAGLVSPASALTPSAQAAAQPTVLPLALPTAHASARPLTGARIRTIVVDAGHGGKDPGARGPDGLKEKNVCLDIALRLRQELNLRDPDLRVVLTRDHNVFVSLQERTAIANRAKGDLFVSIHNNASPDEDTHGTQVFFFDSQSSDRAASDISMRENGEANQLDILMTDLAKSIVRDQSIGFASLVQRALGATINLKHRDISYAPFYVLARTEMPAILVEVAFITNPHEERLLADSGFRQKVARSIATGVENYVKLVQGKS